jgi:hypothetical protein
MIRFLGGCMGRVAALVLVVVVVALAWSNRHQLGTVWDRVTGSGPVATPELAARADDKLASLSGPEGVDRVALHEDELQSLLEYRWAGFLPADVGDPRIEVSDGRVTVEGKVATARFGAIDDLREIVAFLPDTATLRAVASFAPLDSGRVSLEVHELAAAGIPVPRQLIPTVLGRFRGAAAPGVRENAVAVPLPPGIRSVHVSGDSLVFRAYQGGGV